MRRIRDDGLFARSIARKLEAGGIMLLLFETPSGFAIFNFAESYLYRPNMLKLLWGKFSTIYRANDQVELQDFQTFEDKSAAINPVTGVNKQLADMIKKCHSHPKMKLGVAKPEYKKIIESNLKIPCVFSEIVMEVMWGLQNLIHELLPQEKSEVTKEDRLPLSQGLQQVLRRYQFDLEPDMVNQQIVQAAYDLHFCDGVYETCLSTMTYVPLELTHISGINCGDWDALKLATALKVLAFPKAEIDFPELFPQDELSKMKADAPKYKDIIPPPAGCATIIRDIISAHHRRIEKKELLESLVKKAKKTPEAEPAEVYEGGRQGEIRPHVVNPQLPQKKVCKISLNSAFEPVVTYCEGSSPRDTKSRRSGLSFPEAQPLTSKPIVPYKPFPESQLENICNMDSDHNANVCKHVHAVTDALGRKLDALTAELLELKNEVGKMVECSVRVNQKNVANRLIELEGPPCKRPKKSAALDNN